MLNTTISVRVAPTMARALEKAAATTERSKTFVVRKALETYLAEYADYQIALDRLRDKDDNTISRQEIRKHLEI